MVSGICREEIAGEPRSDRREYPYAKVALCTTTGAPRALNRVVQIDNRLFRTGEEYAAGGRSAHPTAMALEEGHAEFILEVADATAHDGLRCAQHHGCPPEAQLLRNGNRLNN